VKLLTLLLVLLVPTASGAPSEGSWNIPARLGLRGTPDERDASARLLAGKRPSAPARHDAGVPLQGWATWYCGGGSPCTAGYDPFDYIAAIDPSTGIRRGAVLRVSSGVRSVRVTVVDVCACSGRRVIDLSRIAFSALADPARGIVAVTLAPAGRILPNTDTLE